MKQGSHSHGKGTVTIEREIRKFILIFLAIVAGIMILAFFILFDYSTQYKNILHNVTTASEFNQDFKESIDLKMYYYVVDSHYSEGLPIEEVKAAQELAQTLLNTTTEKESWKAINGVQKLCVHLESKMKQICDTKLYDERQQQLENNIYVLTELIQEYMYTYLYYEAVHLDELQGKMTVRVYIELFLVTLVLIIAFFVLIRWLFRLGKSITVPVKELCERVQEIRDGDLTVRTPVIAREQEIQVLGEGFEKMVDRINELIDQNRQEQIRLRSTELALLQAQINPHFLYNTLDAIVWLIETQKNDQAVEMVTSLSSFFRSSLSKGRNIITVKEEIQQVRSYLEIQQVRYKDILDYEITVSESLYGYELPKLTLQPLVENALYHGIKLKRGIGRILVEGYDKDDEIILCVSDDGAGMTKERLLEMRSVIRQEKQIGFGLSTVHERIRLHFGPEYGLEISSTPSVGTKVTVRIPKRTESLKAGQEGA